MKKVNYTKKISKEGDTSLRVWESTLFEEMAQDIMESELVKVKKENETSINFDYAIRFIIFQPSEFDSLMENIERLPDSPEKTLLINSLK